MAIPANKPLDVVLGSLVDKVNAARTQTATMRSLIAAGDVKADVIVNLMIGMRRAYDGISAISGTSGLNTHASAAYDNQALDIEAEITSVLSALQSAYNWVDNNFPKDGNGYLLKEKINSGVVEQRVFPQASLSGLDTVLAQLQVALG